MSDETDTQALADLAVEWDELPSGRRVRVGEITIPEWRERIAALQKEKREIGKTIDLYGEFIDRLEASDADCIDAYLQHRFGASLEA